MRPATSTSRAFGEGGAAAAEHLSKGWLVAVDGRLEFVEWETEAGEKRHDYTVVGNVEFLAAPRPAEEDSTALPPPQREAGCLAAAARALLHRGAGPRSTVTGNDFNRWTRTSTRRFIRPCWPICASLRGM